MNMCGFVGIYYISGGILFDIIGGWMRGMVFFFCYCGFDDEGVWVELGIVFGYVWFLIVDFLIVGY